MAISITCFSYSYALDKKFIKFLLLVVLASTFHASASVFILIYFKASFIKHSISFFDNYLEFNK